MHEGISASRTVWLAASVLGFSALAFLLRVRAPRFLERVWGHLESRKGWVPAAFALLAAFGGLLAVNTAYPGYVDQAEANIASVSWLVRQGSPLYHTFDSASRYSLLYGPSSYLTYATALWFGGGSMVTLKLVVVFANLVMVYFLWRSYRTLLDPQGSLLTVALVLVFIFVPRPNDYLLQIRADVLVMSAMAVGLFGATRQSGITGPVALALAVAFIIDTKVTAFVYTLPLFALFMRLRGWRISVLVGLSAVGLSTLPFMVPNVSASLYLQWVRRATGHPSSLPDLLSTLRTLPILAAPLLLLLGPTPWRDPEIRSYVRENRLVLVAMGLSLAFAVIASSRIGAGSHHVLPLVPVIGYEAARLYGTTSMSFAELRPWAFRYLCVCVGIVVAVRVVGGLLETGAIYSNWRETQTTRDEVRSVLRQYSNREVQMGFGDSWGRLTYFRSELVFATNHLLLDETALSDMNLDGVALPPATMNAIETCEADAWLIPKGTSPFSLANGFADFYPWLVSRRPLFSDAFRAAFAREYSKKASTGHFDVWQCDKASAADSQP